MSELDLQAFLQAIEKVGAEHTSTPEKARQFLQDEGVLTQLGQLAEPYAPAQQQTGCGSTQVQMG